MTILNPKNREIFTVSSGSLSQSTGRGRISREGALDLRESRERRDKIFAKKTENAKIENFGILCLFGENFVTPFSTLLAKIKGSLPTNSTTPDRLRTKTDSADFPGFSGSKSSKKSFFKSREGLSSKVRYLVLCPDLHPKRSP